MSRLTQTQVRDLALSVGFTAADARIISAIAMCEAPYTSAGKSYSDFDLVGDQALANDTWGYSYGGLQVRSLRADAGTGRTRDAERLAEPTFNLRSSLTIRNAAGGFTPWSTFVTGQYKAYLQDLYPPPPGVYIVVAGDTLSGIAAKLKMGSWSDWARVNGIRSPYTIFIGEKLLHPWLSYTIQSGDKLSSIASKYGDGLTWQRLATFNAIPYPYTLQVGQVIRIPRAAL